MVNCQSLITSYINTVVIINTEKVLCIPMELFYIPMTTKRIISNKNFLEPFLFIFKTCFFSALNYKCLNVLVCHLSFFEWSAVEGYAACISVANTTPLLECTLLQVL